MEPMEAENLLRKLDRRLQDVEQILPTLATRDQVQEAIEDAVRPLATKEELAAAIAPLPTKEEVGSAKEELRAAIAPLATKEETVSRRQFEEVTARLRDDIRLVAESQVALQVEVRREARETREQFQVVAESLRDDIRLIAESQVALRSEVRQGRRQLDGILKNHQKRITKVEASATRKRKDR